MSNGEQRETHVERFYGEDDNDSSWIDVEMLDQLVVTGRGQKTVHTFLTGMDDMTNNRSYTEKQIKNPDDDNQYVTIKVWDRYESKSAQGVIRSFINDDGETTRTVTIEKIIHREIDDKFLDDDKKPPSDPLDYLDAINQTNSSDDSQHVYVECINERREIGTVHDALTQTARSVQTLGQKTGFEMVLENSILLPGTNDDSDNPVRTDPLQWIVNVSWGLAVEFGDKAKDPPVKTPTR